MTEDQKYVVLAMVNQMIEQHPEEVGRIIEAITTGIRESEETRRKQLAKISTRLLEILHRNNIKDFAPFDPEDTISTLEPNYGGTKALEILRKKYKKLTPPKKIPSGGEKKP